MFCLPVIAVNCCINPFTPGAEASPSAAILPPQTTTQMLRVRSVVPSPGAKGLTSRESGVELWGMYFILPTPCDFHLF